MDEASVSLALGTGSRSSSGSSSYDGCRYHPARRRPTRPMGSSSAPLEKTTAFSGIKLAPTPRSRSAKRRTPPHDARWRETERPLRSVHSAEGIPSTSASAAYAVVPSEGAASGSREGRQFTVGSVGNNGRIYLRPVIRSAHPRPPAPPFVFPPITPPSTADTNPPDRHPEAGGGESKYQQADASTRDSAWSDPRTPRPSARAVGGSTTPPNQHSVSPPMQPRKHQRAHSFSTVNEPRLRESEIGAYRVVIGRPLRRPRTADTASIPALHVRIPTYKLGSPRFSARGTAFLHESTYTHTSTTLSTDPLRSSYFTQGDLDKLFPIPPGMPHHLPRKTSSSPLAVSHNVRTSGSAPDFNRPSSLFPGSSIVIEPSIYDTLTFSPAADSPAVVRYSSTTGEITAATPPRLIAQITSPNFLDYDLLSDFFLTFRSFLSTQHLASYLMARLQWALNLDDENGRIVRVRSFVAMRHWILNYFVDDFVPDLNLRLQFCEMLNAVCDSLYQRLGGPGTDLNVIGELKKCWRRTCALYWDGPEFENGIPPHVDIHPGGVAGSRQAELALLHNPGWNGATVALPQIESVVGRELTRVTDDVSLLAESSAKPKPLVNAHDSGYRSRTGRQASQASDLSLQVASCSLPTRSIRTVDGSHPAPHLVQCSQAASSVPLVASAPLTSKRAQTAHSHKRSGSFSDALRDNRTPLPLSKAPDSSPQLLMAFPYAGGLVRGNLFPPTQALVEVLTPGTPPEEQDPATLHANEPTNLSHRPGVKKFLGNVRRVLSNRYNGVQGGACPEPEVPSSPFAAAKHLSLAHYVETTAIKDKDNQPSAAGGALRMDLLGLEIVEAYERAIQEAEASAGNAEPESVVEKRTEGLALPSVRIPSHLTAGSQSIVIVDDTRSSSDFAMMSGALLVDDSMMQSKTASIDSTVSVATARKHTHRDSKVLTRSRSTSSLGVIQSTYQNSISHHKRPSSLSLVEGYDNDERTPRLLPGATFADSPIQGFKGPIKSLQQASLRKCSSFQGGNTRGLDARSIDNASAYDSQSILSETSQDKPPARLLRRRPGGDLRAAQNVQELGPGLLRPKSAGSITTYTGSIGSSTFRTRTSVTVEIVDDEFPPGARAQFSLGVVSDSAIKTQMSMVDTHSSQPNLRPSFEAELKKLAQIPDDDDDGGIESAMLKLEGKFEGKRLSVRSLTDVMEESGGNMPHNSLASGLQDGTLHGDNELSYQAHGGEQDVLEHAADTILEHQSVEQTTSFVVQERPLRLSATSEDSLSSLHFPHQRDVAANDSKLADDSSDISVPLPLFGTPEPNFANTVPAHPSIEYVEKTMSMLQIPQGPTLPEFGLTRDTFFLDEPTHESFLLDEDENYSDLSSEISMEMADQDDAIGPHSTSFFHDKDEHPSASFPSYPFRHPPSPPLLSEPALPNPTIYYKNQIGNRPPTPELSPVNDTPIPSISFPPRPSVTSTVQAEPAEPSEPAAKPEPLHLPFILAQNSDILAQQFTLVEKDALNEVDWKELVDLRWKQTASGVRNWVDFLKTQEPKGIEVVIARFNLMVKWATSEIVLTQNMEERARCIIKYIHIAAHCRRYRNYATMYQLTIALLSQDISRLSMTWALVSPKDIQILRQLEALVQPIRNFNNLRIEMETVSPDEGCIPFVGIYTHDLIFNSQRPSQIASTPDTDPLINFERQRTTASIVKSLLRLLEASTKYNFQPVEGVIERCLWMAALSDDEIRSRSKALK